MKQYIIEKNICGYNKKEKNFDASIKILVIMVLYRIGKDSFFPLFHRTIGILEFLLPILLLLSCVLLSYGSYYIGEHFLFPNRYQKEECFIDGILLGLLLPIRTPFWLIIIAVFLTVFIGRYFYNGVPIGMPTLIGILGTIGISIWLQICHLESSSTNLILLELTQNYQFQQLGMLDIWLGNVGEWVSKTSPILCILGFLYLRKYIKWKIPVYFIGTSLILLILSNYFVSNTFSDIMKWFASGNILFLLLFCAADTRTTPVTDVGQILFAVFLGIFTYIANFFFTPFLALILSILFSNFLTHFYDYFGNYYELNYCSEYKKVY